MLDALIEKLLLCQKIGQEDEMKVMKQNTPAGIYL